MIQLGARTFSLTNYRACNSACGWVHANGMTENTTGSAEKPFIIENIYEKETTESFVERHFRNRHVNRCRCVGAFNLDAIVAKYGAELIRSARDIEPAGPRGKFTPLWAMAVFQRPGNVFWHFLVKTPGYGDDKAVRSFTLTVTAEAADVAAHDTEMLRREFTESDDAPGFFMVRDVRKPKRIPLKPEFSLSDEMLALHYGEGFAEWTAKFAAGLSQSGLSILRGKPGTGKTSFLRHLIYSNSETHRFYYLPVDAFGLLQAAMTDFLAKESKQHEGMTLVMVLEDAEQLLLNRRGNKDGLASTLLNFTDGFVGDIVTAHLICTINGDIKDLDEAVLRPGRQRFFREFDLLDAKRAAALALKLGISLVEKRAYSLAELYHFKDVQDNILLPERQQRPIGFGA